MKSSEPGIGGRVFGVLALIKPSDCTRGSTGLLESLAAFCLAAQYAESAGSENQGPAAVAALGLTLYERPEE